MFLRVLMPIVVRDETEAESPEESLQSEIDPPGKPDLSAIGL